MDSALTEGPYFCPAVGVMAGVADAAGCAILLRRTLLFSGVAVGAGVAAGTADLGVSAFIPAAFDFFTPGPK